MSGCPIETEARLRQLLARALPEPELAALREHLEHPCDRCLDLLETVGDDELATLFAGDAARLSATEADRMFDAIAPEPVVDRAVEAVRRWWMAPRFLFAGGLAAAAAVALVVVLPGQDATDAADPPWTGVKGVEIGEGPSEGGPRVTVLAGAPDGTVRPLPADAALLPGERALFRVRVDEPSWLGLILPAASSDSGRDELLWSTPAAVRGDVELASGDQALALDPGPAGTVLHVVVVASAGPLEAGAEGFGCTKCRRTSLTLRTEDQGPPERKPGAP